MESLLIKDLKYLITCDDNDRMLTNVNVLIKDGRVFYIGKETFTADQTIDGSEMAAYPGLINTHHHLYQIFSRNLARAQGLALFPWLKLLYGVWKNLDEQVVYFSSLVAMAELLQNGCTTCMDHHYVFPNGEKHLLQSQIKAAEMLGMRIVVSRGSMDLSEKDGGLPPDSVVQSIDEIIADSQNLIETYRDSNPFAMRQIVLAPCSPFSASTELYRQSALLARAYGVRMHTHLAETRDEVDYTLERFGLRPLAYMQSLGWVGEDVWYAHGIHFNSDELSLLAQTGTGIAHCPISNMKLNSGVARIPEMLRLGVKVGLAVDGSASNDGSSLLEEIRIGYLLHRLISGDLAPSGYEMLKLATRGSADLLGRGALGRIEEGAAADMFMLDTRRPEFVAAFSDPKSILGAVGVKNGVDYTIVNGKIIVQDGRLVSMDQQELAWQAAQVAERYLRQL